jgi:DNA-binding NtrC family response regulator
MLMVRERSPEFVLTEALLPDGDGLPLLEAAGQMDESTPVVVVSDRFSPRLVFTSMSMGAFDCLPKPVDDPTLDGLLGRIEGRGRPSPRCRTEPSGAAPAGEPEMVVGRSPEMVEALKTVAAVAVTDATVLIRGESGTGKELLARWVHDASKRRGSFVAVNCAAVVETLAESELFGHERGAFTGAAERRPGCFEQADGGTVFLDEIGDAPGAFQAKLLRVLDRGEFYRVGGQNLVRPDVRVVAATNSELEDRVEEGRFRRDLYYRLCEVTVRLPELRERRCDIPLLARTMILESNQGLDKAIRGVSDTALELLLAFHWPGNVRQLRHAIRRAAMLCRGDTILPEHLHELAKGRGGSGEDRIRTLVELERDHIAEVLEATDWNRGQACRLLGISRPTLRRKMRDFGMESSDRECQVGQGTRL